MPPAMPAASRTNARAFWCIGVCAACYICLAAAHAWMTSSSKLSAEGAYVTSARVTAAVSHGISSYSSRAGMFSF